MSSQTTVSAQAVSRPAMGRSNSLIWRPTANRILLLALLGVSLCHSLKAQDENAQNRLLLRDVVNAINDQRAFERTQVDQVAEHLSEAYAKTCEITATRPVEDAPGFYGPFSATDDIADVWCKMQTLHSDKPIEIALNHDLGSGSYPNRLFVSEFAPDGSVRSGKASFIGRLVKEISRQSARGGLFWKSVERFDAAGTNADGNTPGAIFNGNLTMTAYGVFVSGVPIDITVTFAPQLGLLARQRLTAKPAYLQFAAPAPEVLNQDSEQPSKVSESVAFPWALSSVRLSATGGNAEMLVRDMEGKYRRFVKPYDSPVPSGSSARSNAKDNHRITVAGPAMTIEITEGQDCIGLAGFVAYIDINYHATSGGPLDTFTTGNAEFNEYLAKSNVPQSQGVVHIASRSAFR